jgi:hypothetical protein
MRRFSWLIAGAVGLVPWAASAQQCEAPAVYYSPNVCAPPAAPAPAPPAPAPTGHFLRGPATGQAAGESRSLGLRGFTLRIPAITLATPTVELPSLIKFRRDAEMHFDSSTGPLTAAPVQEFGVLPAAPAPVPVPAPPTPAPVWCVPPACAVPPAGCTSDVRSTELEARLAKLDQLEREMTALRDAYAERVAALDAAPMPPTRGSAAKPAVAKTNTSVVRASRPLPSSQLIQAGFDEPQPSPPWPPLTTAAPRTPATSAVRSEALEDSFGTWSRPSQR